MSTPTKRRKKNDASPHPVRSLDYFFAKQKDAPKPSAPKAALTSNGTASEEAHKDDDLYADDTDVDSKLTDEELARKLQAEWDQEPASTGHASAPVKEVDAPSNAVEEEKERIVDAATDVTEYPETPKPTNPFAKNTLSLQSASIDEDNITANIPFDTSPLQFDPQQYISDLRKVWAKDAGLASYALLTQCFVLANTTQSRIKIVDTITNFLRVIIESDPSSLLPSVWLATNSISPSYIDLELGLGGSAISKALKKVCGLDNKALKSLYDKYGDAGDVAFEAKKRQTFTLRKPKPLTIKGVFDSLVKIANSKGTGSVEVKQRIVERLVQDARGAEESRYIVRTLCQHLRIGAVKTTMLIALSRAFLLSRPEGATFDIRNREDLQKLKKDELAEVTKPPEELLKACFARHPNYNDLVPALLEVGIDDQLLVRCGLGLHVPLRPMLGSITRDLSEMLTKLGNEDRAFTCEFKYDGQRAQVHCDEKGKVTIFSRHLEVMTDKYPDLVALVPKIRGEGVSSFILEGEVVAIDRESGELKTFQTLTNRAKKDVALHAIQVNVCLFAFDLMFLNGQELLERPFRERRSLLRSLFVELPGHFTWVKSMDAVATDEPQVLEFFKEATENKCEGIMVKVLDNPSPQQLDEVAEDRHVKPPTTPSKRKKGIAKTKNSKVATNGDNADETVERDKPSSRRKPLLSTYEPDKRVDSWLKVKKDYNTSADTLDLIPIAGWHGQGRKSKWWSPILLAVRNPETGQLEAVTKCISGFTDAFYKANRLKYDPDNVGLEDDTGEDGKGDDEGGNQLDDDPKSARKGNNTLPSKPSYVDYAGHPDVWFEPQEVWEMAFADITLSPTYTAAIGLVSEERGLSTRFPRFLKVREDKSLEEATTSDELAALWRRQEATRPKTKVEDGGEDIMDE